MAYDVEGALAAGFSKQEIADYLASKVNFRVVGARKAGFSDDEIIQHLNPMPDNGFVSNVLDLAKQGGERLIKGLPLAADVASGSFSEEAPRQLSESLTNVPFKPKELREAEQNIGASASGWEDAKGVIESSKALGNMLYGIAKEAVTNPKGLAYLTSEQIANMVPPITGIITGSKLGLLGGPAAPFTVPAGAFAGGVVGGMVPEMALEVSGFVQNELSNRGLPPTEENIRRLLSDPQISNSIIDKTRKKAAGTAFTDAALTMLGGRIASRPLAIAQKQAKVLGKIVKPTMASKAGYGAAGVGVDILGEGASEAAGQQLATGNVSMADVALETAGGIGGAFVEVPAAAKAWGAAAKGRLFAPQQNIQPPQSQPSPAQPSGDQTFNAFDDFARAYQEGASAEDIKGKRDEYARRPDADKTVLADVDIFLNEIKSEQPSDVEDKINELKSIHAANGITNDDLIPAVGKMIAAYPNEADKIKAAFPNIPVTLNDALKKTDNVTPFTEESDALNKSIIENLPALKANGDIIIPKKDGFEAYVNQRGYQLNDLKNDKETLYRLRVDYVKGKEIVKPVATSQGAPAISTVAKQAASETEGDISDDAVEYSAASRKEHVIQLTNEFKKNGAVKVEDGNLYYVVHKSTKEPGKFQVTTFDAKGPISDTETTTLRDALEELTSLVSPMRYNRPDLPDTAPIGVLPDKAEYTYEYKYRPMSIGTQPDGFIRSEDGGKFGRVVYDRPLRKYELDKFELKPIGIKEITGKEGKTEPHEDTEEVKKAIRGQLIEYKAELINRLASLTKEKSAAKSTREADRVERLISATETELDRYLREKTLPQDRIDSIRLAHAAPVVQGTKSLGARPGAKAVLVFDEKPDAPFIEEMISNPEYYKKEKGKEFSFSWISPSQYLDLSAEAKGTTAEEEIKSQTHRLTEKYTLAMRRLARGDGGRKFPALWVEKSKGDQEGRHRAIAALAAGIDKVPVYIIKDVIDEDSFNRAAKTTPKAETFAERAERTFKETQAKFAEEAASTETITEREIRRKAEAEKKRVKEPWQITVDELKRRMAAPDRLGELADNIPDSEFQSAIDFVSNLPEKLKVYRALSTKKSEIDTAKPGTNWTIDGPSAAKFGEYSKGKSVLVGEVNKSDINLDDTIEYYMMDLDNGIREIKIYELPNGKTPVKNIHIISSDEARNLPRYRQGEVVADEKLALAEEAKEPWQMTREEYEAELMKYEKLTDNQEMQDGEGVPASQDAIDAYNRGDWETFSRARGYSEEAISNFRRWMQLAFGDNFNYNDVTPENIHRQHIQQALANGKLTPEEYNTLHASTYGPLEKFVPVPKKEEKKAAEPIMDIATAQKALDDASQEAIAAREKYNEAARKYSRNPKTELKYNAERRAAEEALRTAEQKQEEARGILYKTKLRERDKNIPESKVIPATKTAEKNVTTPKEQKEYVLDKLDDLIIKARQYWREINGTPDKITDAEIDEKVSNGKFTRESPKDEPTVIIEVPNDGRYKVPNTLYNLLLFKKKFKSLSINTVLPDIKPPMPSKKPTGKPLTDIQKEAWEDYTKLYRYYKEEGRTEEAAKMKQAMKEEYPELYKEVEKQETAEKEALAEQYKFYSDTTEEETEAAMWHKIVSDINDKKITLKSLSGRFNGKTPSSDDVFQKSSLVYNQLDNKIKNAESTKEEIKTKYPELYKEMFSAPKDVSFQRKNQDARYLELAKDPEKNRDELQKMVDEAAKNWQSYDTFASPRKKVYHGTTEQFTVFDNAAEMSNVGPDSGIGFMFTDRRSTALSAARRFARNRVGEEEGRVISAYIKIKNPMEFDGQEEWFDYVRGFATEEDVRADIRDAGKDGVVIWNADVNRGVDRDATEHWWVALDPNQIKMADPITYNDNGNVIPLSERFNPNKEDLRYQRGAAPAGLQQTEVQSVINQALESIPNAPKVNVVQSNQNCPEIVQRIMERDGIDDAMGFTHNGEVYLVANNIRNEEETLRTFAHELTHSGLGKFFQRQTQGKIMPVRVKYEALMDAIYGAHAEEVKQLVKKTHRHLNINTLQGRRQACEEWLCNQSYESQPKWYDKLVAIFHDLLRAVGLDVKLSDAEVRVVLQDAFKEFGGEGVNFKIAHHGHETLALPPKELVSPDAKKAWAIVEKADNYTPQEDETPIKHKIFFHSGTGDIASVVKNGIEPTFGDWVSEVLSGATEEEMDVENNFIPVSFYADLPDWLRMQTARKLGKNYNDVTRDDIKNHGYLAVIDNIDDQYGEAKHTDIYQVLGDSNGAQTIVENAYGEKNKLYETELYEEGGFGNNREAFGVEPGDFVTASNITPDVVLTGDALLEFMDSYKAKTPDIRFARRQEQEVPVEFQRSPVRRSQPMFSRSDNPNYKWWEGMDIQKQLESLPLKFWQKPRNFVAMGYVPITRAEADKLYYDGLDIFVAHVNINGELDTTGNEGLFMRPLSFYGYQYRRFNGTFTREDEAEKRYWEYRQRYNDSQRAIPDRNRNTEAPMGRDGALREEEAPLQKVAESDNRYSTQGEWNNLPIDDTIRNYWKKKVEEQYEHNRTTRENGDVGFADDSRRERDNGIPYPGRLQLGRIFDENVRGLGEETERPQWESVVFAPELIDTPEFKVARDHFSSLGYTTVPISPVPWGMSVNHNLKAVFISPVSGDSFAYFMSHETSHILSKQGNLSIEVIRDGLNSKHPEFIDTAERVGYNEDQMREEMSASIVGGWDHYEHLLTGTDRAIKIQEARKAVIASTPNKQDTKFQRQEKEAFGEASEPVPPEYDLGSFESKRKEIDDYVKRLRRSLEFPETVMLARDLMGGKFPGIKAVVRSAFGNSAFGKFIPQGEGNILLKASIFSDIETASKVLAHEIGHLVDYIPNHLMTRGNILGRIASLNRYMKNYLEEFKGAPGLLTKEDKSRLQKEAREQIKEEEKPDEVIVEEIIREIPQFEVSGISPEIILDLMKGRVEGTIAPELYEYLQRAETKEKKQIVLKAMKDIVDERVAQFGTKKQVGTETVKETVERVIPGVKYDQQTIYKRFKELLQKEISKRVLYRKEVITDELKKLTKLWTPFDDSVDSSYRKYRWSSKELYADAFSVFINYPELMQRETPTFYKAFLSWIEAKPEVKKTYDTYQKLATNREAVLERREKYIYEMQKGHKTKEQEIMDQIKADNKISPRNILRELYKGLIDRNVALMESVKKLKKAGKITAANTLEYFKEERNYLASEADFYLEEVKQKIIAPLEKAGFTEDDLGYLGTLMRTATQRRNVANPGGMGGYFSDEQIEHLKTKLGTERFNTLRGFLEKFSDMRQEYVIPKLEEAGMYSEALLNTIKTEKNYLTFNVTAYMDKMYGGHAQSALGKVYHTLGTFQNIQNPFIATIFKDISLMRAAEITMYKKELHKTFSENEELQDQIQPAEKKFSGTAQMFVEPKDPKMGMISYLKNGKVEAFYITKEIADDFNNKPIEAMHVLRFFNALMMPVKALLVNRNPIWMVRNVVRDYLGTAQNIPGAKVTNLLPYYRKAFVDAWGEVMQGKKLDVVQQMKKAKMLVIDRQYHLSDELSDDTEFDKLYAKFGHHGEKERQIVIEKILQAWDFLGDLGKVSERAGKIAGYRWMKENTNMTEREIGHVVRSRIGTPDVYRRGAWQLVTNNLFLYSNVGKEGFRSSWESFQDGKAAYTWKMVKYSFMPKAVLALAALGAFGDDAEDIIKRISNYDKANYLVVPFSKTADGKAVYLRMPQSYMGQFFGVIAWDLFNLEFKKAFESVAADQPYSFNPVIKAILNWGLYAMDVNPQDWYRGQNIVNRKEWDAGEPYRLMEMSKNTWNSVGGGLLYKFNKGQDPKGVWEQISSLPGLNIMGSFLKESNQGIKEEYYKASQKAKQASALKSMDKDERIAKRERIKRQISDARSLYRKGYIDNKLFDERVKRLYKDLEDQQNY